MSPPNNLEDDAITSTPTMGTAVNHHDPANTASSSSPPPRPRPIIFLDIDGVLNRTRDSTHIRVDSDLVSNLKRLVDTTDADIVLTSFWRHFREYIAYVLHRHGIDPSRVIDSTPGRGHVRKDDVDGVDRNHSTHTAARCTMIGRSASDEVEYESRHEEIESWLGSQHRPIEGRRNYVILDDRPCAARPGTELAERFVKTVSERGLTDRDVYAAIEILALDPS